MKKLSILLTSIFAFSIIGMTSANAQDSTTPILIRLNENWTSTRIAGLPTAIPAERWSVPVFVTTFSGAPVKNQEVVLYYGLYDLGTAQRGLVLRTDDQGVALFRLPGLRALSASVSFPIKRISLQAFTYGERKVYSASSSKADYVLR